MYTIRGLDLPAAAVGDYTSLLWEHYDTTFKECDIGWGIFADEDLPKDAYVLEYCRERNIAGEENTRSDQYRASGIINDYFAALNDEIVIDATFVGN